MAKIVKKSPAPLYLAAAVWAAWAVLAPLYAWWHFALAAAVSAAAWLGGRKLFPDKVLILPDPEPAPEPEPEHAAPEDPLAVERARALAELRRLDALYPEYGFARHKGYGTAAHIEAIRKFGLIPGIYRKSFEPVRTMTGWSREAMERKE